MKFWIARNLNNSGYRVFNKEPTHKDMTKGIFGRNMWKLNNTYLCSDAMKKYTDIRLRPGEFVQVELKEVSDRYILED